MFQVNHQVRFLDLVDLETRARDGLVDIVNRLESLKRPPVAAEREQLALCKAILAAVYDTKSSDGVAEVCDPLFVATRELLARKSLINPPLLSELNGQLVFGAGDAGDANGANGSDTEPASITLVALVLGILAVDGATPPP